MSTTDLFCDLALQDAFWFNGRLWPVIRGGAEDSNSDDAGDSTEGDSSDDTDDDSSDDSKDKGKTFTQEEVNSLLARETSKAKRGKLDPSEFGFKNKAELDEYLKSAREKVDADKSDQEKALDEARKKAEDEARSSVLSTANERLLRAEFLMQAVKNNVEYAEDAFDLAKKLDEWKEVAISDDGSVSGLDDALFEALKESKPFLFKADEEDDGTGDAGAGTRSGGQSDKGRVAKLKEQYSGLRVGH